MKAHEAMAKEVITVAPSTAVRDIAALLVRHRISAVPVVSEDGRVIGAVSQADLVRNLAEATITALAARPENGVLQKAPSGSN
jgi:CBS domain-containing protein